GDETTRLFLESWGLVDKILDTKDPVYFMPILDISLDSTYKGIATKMRKKGWAVRTGLELQKLGNALDYANKNKIEFVIIFGEYEKRDNIIKVKNMETGEEKIFPLTDYI